MEWISVPQLAGVLGITPRAVRKNISKYTVVRRIDSRGGASGKAWEIHISDPAIPADVRRKLGGSAPKREIKRISEDRKMTIKDNITPEALDRARIVH